MDHIISIMRLVYKHSTFLWIFVVALSGILSACSESGGDSANLTEKPVSIPASRGLLPSLARSDDTFEGAHHSGSGACASCHTDVSMTINTPIPGETRNVSIGTAWETSIMANSTRDPYWHAVVASEMDNFPALEEEIADKCTVCHAPAAHDHAKKEGLDMRLFDKGSIETGDYLQGIYTMDETNELFNHAMDGVTCTLCHQMEDVNFGNVESMSGNYTILGSPTTDPDDRPAYGQYTDPEVGYMRQQSGFLPQHGPHLSTSESCATCHNLDVESVDPDGNPLQGVEHFSEQAVYTEWLHSDYAIGGSKEQSCQSCHMPVVDQEVYIAQGASEKRTQFAEHTFLGPNTVMQDMFKNFSEELGIKPGLDWDSAIARNREFLTGAASVTLSEGSYSTSEGDNPQTTLTFDVNIENLTGHKLPSGYHSRRVYLHVQVINDSGELVFESGKMRPDGSIVGVAEDVNPATWEEHHDVISSETQVQVYQAIVSDVNNERTHSLLTGVGYLKDNRLLPSGMNQFTIAADTTLPPSFGTFGKATQDPDFNLGLDTVTYQVAVPAESTYTVSAELRFQPFSYGHLIKLWTQGDRVDAVDRFRTIYEGTTLRDEVIDTATRTM